HLPYIPVELWVASSRPHHYRKGGDEGGKRQLGEDAESEPREEERCEGHLRNGVDRYEIGQQRPLAEGRFADDDAEREADRDGDRKAEQDLLGGNPESRQHIAARKQVLADEDDVGGHLLRRRKDDA